MSNDPDLDAFRAARREPETKTAILRSAVAERFTRHEYDHTVAVRNPADAKVAPGAIDAFAHYFRCTETGKIRQWGLDHAYINPDHAPAPEVTTP